MSGRMGEWSLKLPYEEKPIRLQPSMIFVGRSECDIVVNSTTVDKRHAVIYFNQQDQQFHIKDLNTLSGTYVNGTRIPEQSYVKLEHGDQIRFGYHKQNYEMQLVSDDMPTPTTPMDEDDSLNESKTNNVSLIKGMDSLEDVSGSQGRSSVKELHKNNSVPQLISPTSPRSEGTCLPPKVLPLKNMVSSYCAPVRSPSEPQIDNRMVASLWDSQDKSPTKHKAPTRRPPAVAMVIPADITDNGQRANHQKVKSTNSFEESNGHEKAKAFVINFDEPKRRASIPQSVLQRRDQAARNKEEDCRVSEDSTGTNGNLSDSANFLIQKMLQSSDGISTEAESEGPAATVDDEDDHRSETGTYTVDDPQAREARRKIDMVFGVEEEAFNEYNARNKNLSKNKHAVPVTRTQPVVAPPRRNRTTSSSTFLASSVPASTNPMMSESMISSTISSGSSTGGLPSKPSSIRSKPVAISARQNRRPSSSGATRPPTGRSPTAASAPSKEAPRPNTAKTPTTPTTTSTLRRGPYGGSDFSLESSNSSGSHLTGGESMKVNRAFALRRARLGLQDNVASQKSHLLTGSNPNLFSRQDGGRFSMRLLSSKQRTRPGMENPQHGSGVAGVPNKAVASPKTCRRNESDPCNINLLGQELDDSDDLSRPELRFLNSNRGLDPLSQSTFEASTQGHDVLKDSEMCRSASFNANPRAASPLLLRKETFLKQKTSPQHQALETEKQHAATAAVASPRSNFGGARPSSRTASPSRAAFSPQLQRRTLGSPQVTRKVLPSPQASPFRQQQQQQQPHQPFQQARASLGEKDEPQGLSALDQLVIQAISQLSGKLRLRVGSLMERESKRYPEGSDQSLLITELLSGAVAPPPAVTESIDISKELSGILRNLRNIETSVNTLLALEPAPPVAELVKQTPSPQTEEATKLPDAETLGDTVPRGFFTVAL